MKAISGVRCQIPVVSCGFRFIERSNDVEKTVAVLLNFRGTDAADCAESVRRGRAANGHLGEGPIREYDVRRYLILFGDRPAQIAEPSQQCLVGARQRRLVVVRRALPGFLPTSSAKTTACRARRSLLYFNSGAEAVVAARAGRAGSWIAEISENEAAATALRVRILLNRVELLEVSAPTSVDRCPIDLERTQRLFRRRQHRSSAGASPVEELTRLQRIEQRNAAHASAEPRRQSIEVDGCAVVQRFARNAPHGAEDPELEA